MLSLARDVLSALKAAHAQGLLHRDLKAEAPRSASAALNLADAEALRGRDAEAQTQYRRVLELIEQDPAPGFWQTLSRSRQGLEVLGSGHY